MEEKKLATNLAPIVLFVYNRPSYTRQTLNALAKNVFAKESSLFIYADGAKKNASEKDKKKISTVRDIIREQQWCGTVSIIEATENKGLAASVIHGVTEIVDRFDKAIIIEDDVVTSPFFLQFMNEGLEKYANEERILSLGSWNYYFKNTYSDTFFTHLPDTIAWATWKRAWKKFEPDPKLLLQQLEEKKLIDEFNIGGKFDYVAMLQHQIDNKVSSWGIRWTATAVINNTLTLYPSRSLSKHIGFGADSTHVKSVDYNVDIVLAGTPVLITAIPLIENKEAINEWLNFEKNTRPLKTSFTKRLSRGVLTQVKKIARGLRKNKYGWSGNYSSWEKAKQKCTGYDDSLILEKIKNAALKVKEGTVAYERDGVIFDDIQYSYALLTLLNEVAEKNGGSLKVADFGGSLGSSYFQNRIIFEHLKTVSWSIIEQPNFVKAGKDHLEDGQLKFYYSIDECIANEGIPDVLLISSTIQYIEHPYDLLDELISKGIKYIIIENTAFNYKSGNRVTVQKVPPQIYPASYPCWFLDYNQVKDQLAERYNIVKEYTNELYIYLDNKKIPYRGLVMELKKQLNENY